MPPVNKQEELEEGFKSVISDVIPIIQKLAPLCSNYDELVGMLSLALENQAQLRLLMKVIQEVKK